MAIAVTDSILNVPPGGADPDEWEKPFRLELAPDLDDGERGARRGETSAAS